MNGSNTESDEEITLQEPTRPPPGSSIKYELFGLGPDSQHRVTYSVPFTGGNVVEYVSCSLKGKSVWLNGVECVGLTSDKVEEVFQRWSTTTLYAMEYWYLKNRLVIT